MQHTNKYQLDLIETSDTFSPAPLNENMQKVEAALLTKAQAADHAALDQRVQVLEGHKVVSGIYIGNGVGGMNGQFIDLGFTPRAVIVNMISGSAYMAVPGRPCYTALLVVVENGFTASTSGPSSSISLNSTNAQYAYLAIL